jgi:diguanylate cyclase (GGDEF)-like protein/PAS domain S-box-containing protein
MDATGRQVQGAEATVGRRETNGGALPEEEIAREAEARFRSAFDSAPIGIALVSIEPETMGQFLQVNRAMCELTGRSVRELAKLDFQAITHPDDIEVDLALMTELIAERVPRFQLEERLQHPDHHVVWLMVNASLVRDASGRPLYAIRQVQDINERKHFEGQLEYLADHDPLTGLFNRRRFDQELSRHLAYVRRYGGAVAVLMLDLDNLKQVNDSFGHNAGDELLANTARLIRDSVRETDVLARLGGDEFAVMLPHTDSVEAQNVARHLLDAVPKASTISKGVREAKITASIGIAPFDDQAESATDLLINADTALSMAKEHGRDRLSVFNSELKPGELRPTWSGRIRRALEEDGFVLYRQPILDLQRREVTQHELLLRLPAEDGELILPGAFLYTAERFGLVRALDRWVIARAIDLLEEHPGARVEVNLSGDSVTDAEFPAFIEQKVGSASIDPSGLVFEVTETAAIANMEQARVFVVRMADLGCGFALDDFGAGFGSFYYLKYLPIDYLKIDGEFIRNLPASKTDQLLVKSIVQIAQGLGTRTIAEHVADEDSVSLLTEFGVDYAQGFHIGHPVNTSEPWSAEPVPA